METQNIIALVALVITVVGGGFMWWVNIFFASENRILANVKNIEIDMPTKYVLKTELRELLLDFKQDNDASHSELKEMVKGIADTQLKIMLSLDYKGNK